MSRPAETCVSADKDRGELIVPRVAWTQKAAAVTFAVLRGLPSATLGADMSEMVEELVTRLSAERAKPLAHQSNAVYRAIEADIEALQNTTDAHLHEDRITLAIAGPLRSKLIGLSHDADEARASLERYQSIAAKGWPVQVRDAVYRREIIIGMTPEQVRAAWGEPSRIRETVTATRHREQWVYGNSYVYFEKGAVVAVQRTR